MIPFSIAFHHATPHGTLTAVAIPDAPDPVPDAVLNGLPEPEAAFARDLRGYRQVQFVGGRIALRAAAAQLGQHPPPLLCNERGAPILPSGLVGSVSHKRTLAIGMVAPPSAGSLGVDIEDYGPPRPAVAKKVLQPQEFDSLASLPPDRRWIGTLLRFSIKESVYKALDPYVGRYVGFQEANVALDLEGGATVRLDLTQGEGPFSVDARYEWLHGRILTSVRIKPADG